MFKNIGLIASPQNTKAVKLAEELVEYLTRKNGERNASTILDAENSQNFSEKIKTH